MAGALDLHGLILGAPGEPGIYLLARFLLVELLVALPILLWIGPRLTSHQVRELAPRTYDEHFAPRIRDQLDGAVAQVQQHVDAAVAQVDSRIDETLQREQLQVADVEQLLDSRLAGAEERVVGRVSNLVTQHIDGFLRQLQANAAAEAQAADVAEARSTASEHGKQLAQRSAEARQARRVSRAQAEAGLAAQITDRGFGQWLPMVQRLAPHAWEQAVEFFSGGDLATVEQILAPWLQLAQKQAGQPVNVSTGAAGKMWWQP